MVPDLGRLSTAYESWKIWHRDSGHGIESQALANGRRAWGGSDRGGQRVMAGNEATRLRHGPGQDVFGA